MASYIRRESSVAQISVADAHTHAVQQSGEASVRTAITPNGGTGIAEKRREHAGCARVDGFGCRGGESGSSWCGPLGLIRGKLPDICVT